MPQIDVSRLSFTYEGSFDPVFEDVSFQIDTDWKLGFIGRNGRGKTTFLRLLQNQYPYEGKITAPVRFEYFPYEGVDSQMHAPAVISALSGESEEWKILRELSRLEFGESALKTPYSDLSGGERTKVQIAAMFLKQNSFLLIDEPTNHLDEYGRRLLADYLAKKSGFILVSHDRALLNGSVDHILSIERAKIRLQRGNFESWMQNKQREDQFELAQNERLKKDIKRLDEAFRRTAGWSDKIERSKIGSHAADRGYIGRKAADMMKRAKSVERRVQNAADEKSALLKNIDSAGRLKLSPLTFHSQNLVTLSDLSIFYGPTCAVRDVRLRIDRGDRVAIRGKNGSGKSSVLKCVCGEDLDYTGGLFVARGLKISRIGQQSEGLRGALSAYAREAHIDESLFMTILRKLDFKREQLEKPIESLSAGQKKKVLIARSLCEQAHLYVWDEPLNYIDLLSRMQIEALIREFAPTMLFVEHDGAFIDAVATKIITL